MATLLEDGRWQARYRPKTGTAKVWYADTNEGAESLKAEYLRSLAEPELAIRLTGETTLQDYAKAAWWPRVEASKRDTTESRYRHIWTKHLRPHFGMLKLEQITNERLQSHFTKLTKEMKAGKISANEIHLRVRVLSLPLQLAVKNRLIPSNPASGLELPAKPKRIRVITVEKTIEVLRATEGDRLACPIFLALVCGMSRGEAAGLKWENIDRTARRVHVTVQRRRIRIGKYAVEQTETKRDSRVRSFVLPETLFAILLRLGDEDSGFVCAYQKHRPWHPETITEKWAAMAPVLGLAGWTFHDLRHATAGLLAQLNVDLLTIAAILGHSSIDTTKLYASAHDATATRGMEALGNALFPVEKRIQVASVDAIRDL